MAKVPYCFPILGGRKVEHLLSNLEALDISLSPEQIAYLESVVPFDPGFPSTMIVGPHCVAIQLTYLPQITGRRDRTEHPYE
jgi:diketogulonate reductase-like aldo/keto reductase